MNRPLWTPSSEDIENSAIHQYIKWLHTEYEVNCEDWSSLHQWSVQHKETFWHSLVRYFDIAGDFS
ncbi:MAG: hypothetical protein D6758_11060, partial [Gammaproteobacteria bacterium]